MPKHIARLVLLIVLFGIAALFAKSFFTVDSFYRYGHYRGDSVAQIAAQAPAFQTPRACNSCHAPRHAEWSGGLHKTVICEVCHGAAPGHPESLKATIPPDTLRLCTQCHERMPGRPATVRQIDPAQHYPGAPQCITCHNPHTPKVEAPGSHAAFDARAAQSAAATCAACHGANGAATNDIWPNLAGQNAAYLARAIGSFKTGARKDDTMSAMAQAVADADVRTLAQYFSAMRCAGPLHAGTGNAAAGRTLAARCTSCHGASGRPVNDAWPALAGQNPAYLATALTAFRDGKRSNVYMAEAAKGLSDADIANLATYFSGLHCSAKP